MIAPSVQQLLGEFRRRLAAYRLDPVGFARELLETELHPGQVRWAVRGYRPENALTTGNRYGKSTGAAVKMIFKAATHSGWTRPIAAAMARKHELYRTVNIGPTMDQAKIVWLKAFGMLQNPKASWLVKDVKLTPFPHIELVTGATIEARSTARDGQYLLGHSFDHVNWDEAALEARFVHVRDNVIRMRLVDRRGMLDYTTTGQGRNEYGRYFLRGLEGKEPILYAQMGNSLENPNIDHESILRNAARMSDALKQQNIEGAIIDAGGDFFAIEDLNAARETFADEVDLDDGLQILAVDEDEIAAWAEVYPSPLAPEQPWRLRFASHRYIHAWDLADKSDWTVGSTWDLSTKRATMVEFERFHKRGWKFVYSRIRDRKRRYGGNVYLDLTGVGDPVGEELSDIGAEGMIFTGPSKDAMLEHWKMLINLRQVRWPTILPWVDEHGWYRRPDKSLIKDCVMSGALAGWYMRKSLVGNAPASAYR